MRERERETGDLDWREREREEGEGKFLLPVFFQGYTSGLQIFSRLVGRSDPWSGKWWSFSETVGPSISS